MNLARGLAVYLFMWRKVYGEGSTIPFPGGIKAWEAVFNFSSMPTYAFGYI